MVNCECGEWHECNEDDYISVSNEQLSLPLRKPENMEARPEIPMLAAQTKSHKWHVVTEVEKGWTKELI